MDKILSYTLRAEDLEDTAGGLVNLILRNRIGVSGHEISRAKFLPSGITVDGIPVTVKERILPGQTLRVVCPSAARMVKCFVFRRPLRLQVCWIFSMRMKIL